MRVYKKRIIFTTLLCLVPILAGLAVWGQLPETMATHFGADGTPNDWSSKFFAVIGLPLLIAAMHLICALTLSADPKKRNIQPKMVALVLWICPAVSWFGCGYTLLYALGIELDITLWAQILVGILFIVVGNFLPKMRQSYTMGIRLPWTLHDEDNWDRTHRMAGWVWMAGGAVMALCGIARVASSWITLAIVALLVVVPTVYSYSIYRKKQEGT